MSEEKHRKWNFIDEIIPPWARSEHNTLYDAWQAAEARVRELEAENKTLVDKDLGHTHTIYNLETEVDSLKDVLAGIGPVLTREEVEGWQQDWACGTDVSDIFDRILSRLPARLPESTEAVVGLPSDEELTRIAYLSLHTRHTMEWEEETNKKGWQRIARAVREAVEAHYKPEIARLTEEAKHYRERCNQLTDHEVEHAQLAEQLSAAAHRETELMTQRDQLAEKLAAAEASLESEYEYNQIRNKHDLELTEELKTALGKRFDPRVMTFRLIRDLARERDGYRIRLTETVEKYDRFIAENETLREKFAECQAEKSGLHQEIKSLQERNDELNDSLEPTAARPVRVRWTCTADDFNSHFSAMDRGLFEPEVIPLIKDYLADHAVIDVPEGVPTAEELAVIHDITYHEAHEGGLEKDWVAGFEEVLQHLTPWLQPSAAVDPKLCAVPFEIGCKSGTEDVLTIQPDVDDVEFNISNVADCFITVVDAHRAGMWLLSFAASHGIDVRLPVRPEPEPIATAKDLEQLAEIGWNAFKAASDALGDGNCADLWEDLSENEKQLEIAHTTAILRAAKPELDIEGGKEYRVGNETYCFEKHTNYLVWLNSRIRYSVELPLTLSAVKDAALESMRATNAEQAKDRPVVPPEQLRKDRLDVEVEEVKKEAKELREAFSDIIPPEQLRRANIVAENASWQEDMPGSHSNRLIKELQAAHEATRNHTSGTYAAQRECYERVFVGCMTGALETLASDYEADGACGDAHDVALQAARTLSKRLADLDAALAGKDGEG